MPGDTVRRIHAYADRGVAAQVKEGVQQHGAVASRQHKSVAVEPEGVCRVVVHELIEEQVGHGGTSHGHAWVPRVSLVDSINGQEADCVDGSQHVLLADLNIVQGVVQDMGNIPSDTDMNIAALADK